MQNNFRELEELVLFELWIPDSGSGFPVSGFLVLGLPLQMSVKNNELLQ